MEGPGHQVLLPTSVPKGSYTVCTWVGRRGHCVFSEQRSSQNCWQEIVGTVGRGRLVDYPPKAHHPSARGGGAARGPWER